MIATTATTVTTGNAITTTITASTTAAAIAKKITVGYEWQGQLPGASKNQKEYFPIQLPEPTCAGVNQS